jgi:hypothetical protein
VIGFVLFFGFEHPVCRREYDFETHFLFAGIQTDSLKIVRNMILEITEGNADTVDISFRATNIFPIG